MTGKTRIVATLAVLCVAACAPVRENTAPSVATIANTPPRITTPPAPKATPAPNRFRTTPRSTPSRPTAPAPTPPPRPAAQINANVTREADNSLLVSRGENTQPVPLFRQAIVLANVRAAVAGLPAQPKAEFNRGLLTLTFPPGSKAEATAAINRALTVPEVTRLRANLPP